MMRSFWSLLLATAITSSRATVLGQGFEEPTNTRHPLVGVGSAELKRPANQMIVLFPLTATGTDIREATASLEKVIGAAKAKILELGAVEDSIRTDVIKLHQATEESSRRMMAQVRRSMSSRSGGSDPFGKPEEPGAAAELVTVTTSLRGSWRLEGNTPTEALASSWDLQKAIEAAEVMPSGTQEGLSPEEQEILEESQMFDDSGNSDNSNVPVYVFVNAVTSEERAKLLKDAFKVAEENARETAAIIGSTPGPPLSIAIVDEDSNDTYDPYRYQMSNNYENVAPLFMELKSKDPLLMIGLSPSDLSYPVSVRCGFDLTNGK